MPVENSNRHAIGVMLATFSSHLLLIIGSRELYSAFYWFSGQYWNLAVFVIPVIYSIVAMVFFATRRFSAWSLLILVGFIVGTSVLHAWLIGAASRIV